ncbi:hypothetical protein MMC32_002087 [Xylographa parallela]|nr:hypothetical protein [Xylographa parallela]
MPTATAVFNGKTIAKADSWETVEGSIYAKFPPSSLDKSVFSVTDTHTGCPWKGEASYYTIKVDDKEEKDAAWFYPEPKEKAMNIKDHVAFCRLLLCERRSWADAVADGNKVQISTA